ncbi:hypothetical protein [Streptomyces sp. NRRL B-1140]|uniref:hypothetical protein n=1 Tax=Streptomyces sp. NRRL B-1140 TaxID=1415549 RepID=UPI000A81B559|nr:hypothetical protein [Streptomyces sp. NRRL B-1140]
MHLGPPGPPPGPRTEAIVAGEPERAVRLARGRVEGFEQPVRPYALVTVAPVRRRAAASR